MKWNLYDLEKKKKEKSIILECFFKRTLKVIKQNESKCKKDKTSND